MGTVGFVLKDDALFFQLVPDLVGPLPVFFIARSRSFSHQRIDGLSAEKTIC
jgi:hypothetical protein